MDERFIKPATRHRLPASAYATPGTVWHVTFGVNQRTPPPFANPVIARAIADVILASAQYTATPILLLVLMPDHAHLLIEVHGQPLGATVSSIKKATTRRWSEVGGTGRLWQRSFYDRGLRRMEDVESVVHYLLENPVRAGLVETWEEYPFIGGTLLTDEPPDVS